MCQVIIWTHGIFFLWRINNYYVEINKKMNIILFVVDIDFFYNKVYNKRVCKMYDERYVI